MVTIYFGGVGTESTSGSTSSPPKYKGTEQNKANNNAILLVFLFSLCLCVSVVPLSLWFTLFLRFPLARTGTMDRLHRSRSAASLDSNPRRLRCGRDRRCFS